LIHIKAACRGALHDVVMIKSILVATGGGASDTAVFETALAAARPVAAHLNFVHLQPRMGDALMNTPYAASAMGIGLLHTVERVKRGIAQRSQAAQQHFEEFCARQHIDIVDRPDHRDRVTANWQELVGDALECLTFAARHHDLMVMGRSHSRPGGLASELAELLMLRSGRPLLLAPAAGRDSITRSILVCWRETTECAHTLAAALPLLAKAERVTLLSVHDNTSSVEDYVRAGLDEAAGSLSWHGISADTHFAPANGRPTADILSAAARDYGADLIVMGAYGHSRLHEMVFGGCTQHFVRDETAAVFLAH
jgi:nucleotide-binding universal stress UspA family protein